MRRSKNISLYIVCSIFLTSCDKQPGKPYVGIQNCEEDYPIVLCNLAYDKALEKDHKKTSTTLDQCQQQYNQCDTWHDGYAPIMKGFTVHLPDEGYPVYEQKSKISWWGRALQYLSWWGEKPRAGGFGQHGHSFGG